MQLSAKSLKLITLAAVLAAGTRAMADDEDHLAKAPGAVQAIVKKIVGSGKLEGFDNEEVDGKPAYDVDFSIGGSSYAMLIGQEGQVIQREVEVNVSIVPPEVLDAGARAHPDGKIAEASIITHGEKMFYELEMKVGKDEHDVEISAGGKILNDTVAKPEAADGGDKGKGGTEKKKD